MFLVLKTQWGWGKYTDIFQWGLECIFSTFAGKFLTASFAALVWLGKKRNRADFYKLLLLFILLSNWLGGQFEKKWTDVRVGCMHPQISFDIGDANQPLLSLPTKLPNGYVFCRISASCIFQNTRRVLFYLFDDVNRNQIKI